MLPANVCLRSDRGEGGCGRKSRWLSCAVGHTPRCFCKLVWCYNSDKSKGEDMFWFWKWWLVKKLIWPKGQGQHSPIQINEMKYMKLLSFLLHVHAHWNNIQACPNLSRGCLWQFLANEISLGRNRWCGKEHLCLSKGGRVKRKPYVYFSGHPG